MATAQTLREKFSFTSSIAADVWTPKPNAKAYEWWYFDALSDDGRDAVVIIFLDNFIFSPRYNRRAGEAEKMSSIPNQIRNPQSQIRNRMFRQSLLPIIATGNRSTGQSMNSAVT